MGILNLLLFCIKKYIFLDFDTCRWYQFTTTDEDTQSKQQQTTRRQPLSPSKLIIAFHYFVCDIVLNVLLKKFEKRSLSITFP